VVLTLCKLDLRETIAKNKTFARQACAETKAPPNHHIESNESPPPCRLTAF